MRIISGSARGRRLIAPPGDTTRPTTDRVKEAIFNSLFSLGGFEDEPVCDLFAGSGALGLEALSRGASDATFVERDRQSLETLRQNIEIVRFADQATVVAGDVLTWLRNRPGGREFSVIFADPPYGFDQWPDLLGASQGLSDLLVIESNRKIDSQGWDVLKEKAYGATVVTILGVIEEDSDAQQWRISE